MSFDRPTPVQWIARTENTGGSSYRGNGWTEAAAVATAAIFDPGGSSENTQTGDTVVTQPTLYDVDLALNVTAFDVFVIDGVRYEVDGQPRRFRPPFRTSRVFGQVIPLREVTG